MFLVLYYVIVKNLENYILTKSSPNYSVNILYITDNMLKEKLFKLSFKNNNSSHLIPMIINKKYSTTLVYRMRKPTII